MCILPQYKYWGKIVNWFFNNYGKILTIVFKDFRLHHLSFLFCFTHHSLLLFLFGLTSGPLDAKCSYSKLLKCGHIYSQAFYTHWGHFTCPVPSLSEPALEGFITNKRLIVPASLPWDAHHLWEAPPEIAQHSGNHFTPPPGAATLHPRYLRCVPVRGFTQRLWSFPPLHWLSFETIQEVEE